MLAIYILSEMLKVLLLFWIMRCYCAVFQSRELFLLYSELQLFFYIYKMGSSKFAVHKRCCLFVCFTMTGQAVDLGIQQHR